MLCRDKFCLLQPNPVGGSWLEMFRAKISSVRREVKEDLGWTEVRLK